jgi:hypothetical protein
LEKILVVQKALKSAELREFVWVFQRVLGKDCLKDVNLVVIMDKMLVAKSAAY